ncbi:hypothetical protein BVC71_11815 [Marivivens niveibacter]|uniref:Uncharacterized protein n=1 Tax=Marivivens niveibacter TaxID=1930667 RepID=A0A251WWW6_9RHOB|nr:hypothetical protein [Marivivens niveibacter]OUD08618.1 hypothetical protein BVC71_11815 [Marivivens niveibacter]
MDLPDLKSDCMNCAALCCVSLVLDKGKMFAIDKEAGRPCPNLGGHLCTIHDDLKDRGFQGCINYECAGAGQRVTQMRFNGESWRDAPELLPAMMRDFANLRPLHERMTMLVAAEKYPLTDELEQMRQKMLRKLARSWADTPQMSADFDAFLEKLRPIAQT